MNKNRNKYAPLMQNLLLLILLDFTCGDKRQEIIDAVNAMNTSWEAWANPPFSYERMYRLEHTIVPGKNDGDLPTLVHQATYRREIPATFDARKHWPYCRDIIDYRRDQGTCSSSWAVATASMISDRICIGSKGLRQIHMSAEDILTCCPNCTLGRSVCSGGSARKAFMYWKTQGVVSGGNYVKSNDNGRYMARQGCKPYSSRVYLKAEAPFCTRKCTNPEYKKKYKEDKIRAQQLYSTNSEEYQIQQEIMNNGPVVTFMQLYEDHLSYKAGVYQHVKGNWYEDHFFKIIGWGAVKKKKYWLLANSYGVNWGKILGLFRVIRGVNHCQVEESVMTGRIVLGKKSVREWVVYEPSNSGNWNNLSWLKCLYLSLVILLFLN